MNTSCNRVPTSTALANERDVQKAEVTTLRAPVSLKRGLTIYTDELNLSQCISTEPAVGPIIGFKVF